MDADRDTPLFSPIHYKTFLARLWEGLVYAFRQLTEAPGSYLRVALLPDSLRGWLPVRTARELSEATASFVSHPVASMRDTLKPDEIGSKRMRVFWRVLGFSGFLHSGLILALLYVAIVMPFMGFKVVDKPYEKIDVEKLLAHLKYSPTMLRGPANTKPMTWEELQERDRKRREERERRQREEAAREAERKKKEEEDRKAEEARIAAEKAKKEPSQFKEINTAPLKDIVGKIYETYQAGELGIDTDDFSIMAGFRIDPDGSIPATSIKIIKGSGSKILDKNAIELLWRLGESHALGPLSKLSSQTIKLEVKDATARLTITSFAPTAEEAKSTASSLNFFLGLFGASQKDKSPNVAQLIGMLKVTSDNKRVDAQMTIPKARASEMLKAQYGSTPNQ
ncbi:MAG TPA: hypothetical protein VFV34_21215 [Blastocatellia bacterium]|nr:hypothetical protein [Blastocatellia bacterium]